MNGWPEGRNGRLKRLIEGYKGEWKAGREEWQGSRDEC
jgi:hypothetical protein